MQRKDCTELGGYQADFPEEGLQPGSEWVKSHSRWKETEEMSQEAIV